MSKTGSEPPPKPAGFKDIKKILSYSKNKWPLWGSIIASIICGVLPAFSTFTIGNITTQIVSGDDFLDSVRTLVIKRFSIALANNLMWIAQYFFRGFAGPIALHDIRTVVYNHLLDLDISFYDETTSGVLLSRLTADCSAIKEIVIEKVGYLVWSVVFTLSDFVLAFVVAWQVTLSVIIVIPISLAIFAFGNRLVVKAWAAYNTSSTDAAEKAEQVITSFRTVKSFDNELYEVEEYKQSLRDVDNIYRKTSKINGIKMGVIAFIIGLMVVAFEFFCSWAIVKKPEWGITAGAIVVLNNTIVGDLFNVIPFLSISDDIRKAANSARALLDIIETPAKTNQDEGQSIDSNMNGKIEFVDVKFKYASRSEMALNGLSFTIEPGQTVALVGESGCGKTTAIQLLQRFYEVESGDILIDGKSIKGISPRNLRRQVAVVPQTPVLFSMSIKDNIRYARKDATEEECRSAAEMGNASTFIDQMPDGYETTVEQTSLSGGQKQRVCISRAILTNSPILLLDEATAALDTESERLVQASLEKIRHGKTAIVVAHRLATVKGADRIFVIEDGKVLASGKHEELLKSCEYYNNLVRHQLQ